jgi:hypothetical protein
MMLGTLLFCLAISFIMTTMLAQLFPDGRFPLATLLLVIVAGTAGAWVGNQYLEGSLVTGALLGATVISAALLVLFHRLGLLVADLPPTESREEGEQEQL